MKSKHPSVKPDPIPIFRALILALAITGLLAVVHFSGLTDFLNLERLPLLQEKLAALPWLVNRIFFITGGAAVIVCGLGRSAVSLAAGLFYGPYQGALFSIATSLLASLIIFIAVRKLGRPQFLEKVKGHIEKADKLVAAHGFIAVIIIRQLPLACMMVNILLALTRVSLTEFIFGSIIGFFPEAVIFALYGSSTQGGFFGKVTLASLLLITAVIGVKILQQKFNINNNN